MSCMLLVCLFKTKPQPQPQSPSEPYSAPKAPSAALHLPEDNHWDVFITHASSTANVYFRLVDHSVSIGRLQCASVCAQTVGEK